MCREGRRSGSAPSELQFRFFTVQAGNQTRSTEKEIMKNEGNQNQATALKRQRPVRQVAAANQNPQLAKQVTSRKPLGGVDAGRAVSSPSAAERAAIKARMIKNVRDWLATRIDEV